jgi:hypothetical protein
LTPDDVRTVQRSWSELHSRCPQLLAGLTRRFEHVGPMAVPAAQRAVWLCEAVQQLVGLLPVPSRLADRARDIAGAWPDPLTAPSFAIDGRAWMGAAAECARTWTNETDAAWRQAWLLLSDVLAAETLSPFADATGMPVRRPSHPS